MKFERRIFFAIVGLAGLLMLPAAADEAATTGTAASANAAGARPYPELSAPGAPGYLLSEFIYSPTDRPTPSCHASTIVETESGLVAAWFGGTRERDPDVGIWVSRLTDGQWSRPVEVVNGVQSPTERLPCWNPVLFLPKDGPLLLFYKVGPAPKAWWGMMMNSTDDGKSWSTPRRLGENAAVGHLIGPVKNKPIQLADGAILCPTSTEHAKWRVHFELTRDLGQTWEVIGPINDGEEFAAIQPSFLTYPDGRMQVLCRSKQSVLAQSWSEDGGKTWSKMTGAELPNPDSGTDAVTLKDGRQLLVYNHTTRSESSKGRDVLNVALSKDGRKWTPVLTLENDPRGAYAYPAVIQTKDGLAHITYTWKRESIKHAVLDPDKLALP